MAAECSYQLPARGFLSMARSRTIVSHCPGYSPEMTRIRRVEFGVCCSRIAVGFSQSRHDDAHDHAADICLAGGCRSIACPRSGGRRVSDGRFGLGCRLFESLSQAERRVWSCRSGIHGCGLELSGCPRAAVAGHADFAPAVGLIARARFTAASCRLRPLEVLPRASNSRPSERALAGGARVRAANSSGL